jgi:hypothetical protein
VDAEKFDKVVLDLLYDELDELTRASAIRHTEQSARAKALYAELRATREVGELPLVEPPPDLEARILAAEERARAERPLRQRLGTLISIAASYAMRPQLGMAAVLLLMVGSSLLLLRVKPGAPSSVQVTERGVPEAEREAVAVVPVPAAAPSPAEEPAPSRSAPKARADAPRAEAAEDKAAAPAGDRVADLAPQDLAQPAAGPGLGELGAGAPAATPGTMDPSRQRYARSAAGASAAKDDEQGDEDPTGCRTSLPRYEEQIAHPTSATAASAARLAAADCYARLGNVSRARRIYSELLSVPGYSDRAQHALASLGRPTAPAATAAEPAEPAKPAAKAAAATSEAPAKAAPQR